MLHISRYSLSVAEARHCKLTDGYSLHRVVYDLFEDVRGGNTQEHSGILFADKGHKERRRQVLVLSNRPPREPELGELEHRPLPPEYLEYPFYDFEVVVNPVRREQQSRRIVPVRDREGVARWFCERAAGWGFAVHEPSLLVADMAVECFFKGASMITIGKARLTGSLKVTDRDLFVGSVSNGIGRGRAFGCGLLQIVPKQQ